MIHARRAFAGLTLILTVLICALADPASAANRIRLVSPGGIVAWFVQDSTVPLVAMEYSFVGGSAQDPADKPGVGNMMASLLDEGAADLDSKTFHERLERRAIEMNFSVSRDYLRGSLRMLKNDAPEAFDLLRMALTSPRFDAEPVERIRSQIISGLRRETTMPNSVASRKFWEEAYGTHPYGHAPSGTLDSVQKLQAADLVDYKQRIIAKDTLKIAVVGDIDAASLGKLLDQTFGGLPAQSRLAPVADIDIAKKSARSFVQLDVPQTSILFGGAGIKRDDPDFMAAFLVNHILASGSFSSRLYKEVREKRGLAYSVSESLVWMKHSPVYVGSTATRADKAGETLNTIAAELVRMGTEGPTQQELDEAKSYLKGSQMLALDTSSKIAGALLQYQNDGLGIDYIEKRSGIIDAVTLEGTKRVAKKIWGPDFLAVSVGRAPVASAQPPAAN